MSGSVSFSGSIVAGSQGSGDCGTPSGVTNIAFGTLPATMAAPVSAYNNLALASPSSFVALPGIGATSAVTKGNLVYARTNAPMMLRLVYFALSGNVTIDIPVYGPLVWQVPDASYLVSASIQGTGQVEFYVSGNQ